MVVFYEPVGVAVGVGVGVGVGISVILGSGVGVGRLGWGIAVRIRPKTMLETISRLSTQSMIRCPLFLGRFIFSLRR